MKTRWVVVGLAAAVALSACGKKKDKDDLPPGIPGFIAAQPALPFDSTSTVEFAVGFGYPTQSVLFGLIPAVAGQLNGEQDGCPVVTDNSDEPAGITDVLIEGTGCTVPGDPADPNDNDTTYLGTITILGDNNGSEITYTDYESQTAEDCNGPVTESQKYNGTVGLDVPNLADPNASYDILLRVDISGVDEATCDPIGGTIGFDMVVDTSNSGADLDMDGTPDEFITFDASGDAAYQFTGDFAGDPTIPTGAKFSATSVALRHSTIDEVGAGPDDCNEPLDGSYEISAGGSTASLSPDGLTACTIDSCAGWSLDGTLQPDEICNIPGCHFTSVRELPRWTYLIFGLLAAIFVLVVRRVY